MTDRINTAAARRAWEETTQGEWTISTETRGDEICTIHGVPRQPTEDGLGQGWVYIHYQNVLDDNWHWANENEKLANARFIARAHGEYPALLDEIERLRGELTERERQIVAWLRGRAQLFDQFAAKGDPLRKEYIALWSAYSHAAGTIERGEPWGEKA